jgi:2-polyprenyl-3-methyl-5-hydroxy-6-metoxy-1,4-benzoquinol methylase
MTSTHDSNVLYGGNSEWSLPHFVIQSGTMTRNQSEEGELAARLNRHLFAKFVHSSGCAIDFGCGGGFMLAELSVHRPIGIDVNRHALEAAKQKGIEVYDDPSAVADEVADVVISSHALEHVENPLRTLRTLFQKVKSGGLFV